MIIMAAAIIVGHNIKVDKGRVDDEVIMGAADVVRDLFASITVVIGGRSSVYESKLADAHEAAMSQLEEKTPALGAHAVVGVDLDYEVVGQSIFMVSIGGTAVLI